MMHTLPAVVSRDQACRGPMGNPVCVVRPKLKLILNNVTMCPPVAPIVRLKGHQKDILPGRAKRQMQPMSYVNCLRNRVLREHHVKTALSQHQIRFNSPTVLAIAEKGPVPINIQLLQSLESILGTRGKNEVNAGRRISQGQPTIRGRASLELQRRLEFPSIIFRRIRRHNDQRML